MTPISSKKIILLTTDKHRLTRIKKFYLSYYAHNKENLKSLVKNPLLYSQGLAISSQLSA